MAKETKNETVSEVSVTKTAFSGRLRSINAVDSGNHFQFALAGKKRAGDQFFLDTSNLAGLATMANIVASAYFSRKRIHVTATPVSAGLKLVSDIRVGAKTKMSKAEKKNAKKLAAAPEVVVHFAS